jgi:hypothetical protein
MLADIQAVNKGRELLDIGYCPANYYNFHPSKNVAPGPSFNEEWIKQGGLHN